MPWKTSHILLVSDLKALLAGVACAGFCASSCGTLPKTGAEPQTSHHLRKRATAHRLPFSRKMHTQLGQTIQHLYCFSSLGQKITWMRANPLVCIEVDEVVNQLHWKSVVVFGKYEELCDVPSCVNAREYALELLQKRAMWWQPAYVATEHQDSRDALIPVFYRIRINQVTGHRGTPDSFEEAGSNAIASIRPKAKWSLLSRWC